MAGTICSTAGEYIAALKAALDTVDAQVVDRYAALLVEARRGGRRVWVFGNGGSASTASHHVCDYVKTASGESDGPRLRAFSLVDNTELLTALGNDVSYDDTLSYPLASYAEAGDVAVAISCSGNSPNVVNACSWAKANGLSLVAITGFKGGKIGAMADIHINVPSDNYGVIEDVHLTVGHIATQRLCAETAARSRA